MMAKLLLPCVWWTKWSCCFRLNHSNRKSGDPAIWYWLSIYTCAENEANAVIIWIETPGTPHIQYQNKAGAPRPCCWVHRRLRPTRRFREASAAGLRYRPMLRTMERGDSPHARSTRPPRRATRHRSEPRWRRRVVPPPGRNPLCPGWRQVPHIGRCSRHRRGRHPPLRDARRRMAATADDGHQTLMPDWVAGHQGDAQRRPLPRWFADSAHRDGRARCWWSVMGRGVWSAIEECLPRTARQHCLAHEVRNLQSKVPEDLWPEFNARAVRLLPGGLAGASVKDCHSSSSCRIPAA